ncbi:MAG: metal-dependent transcriptional regulator [Candidatus Bathyarchaeota archaeon]|nr:metal-dependent transcriptional regulator [Candidatus Bathyarchaeota archaeon]
MDELTDREEDYLKAILEVTKTKGYARIKDIAMKVNVKPASAVGMMKKLSKKKYVNYQKYEGITLTESGMIHAEAITLRHEIFKKFLRIICVPDQVAEKDAHILEHQLDPKTIIQFKKFVEFITNATERPLIVSRLMEMFKKFSDEADRPN